MTVESNYVIAIATLSDWLKRLAPVFSTNENQNQNQSHHVRASSELQVITRNCDCFIAMPALIVIGRSNCFGFGFSTVIWKPLYLFIDLSWSRGISHHSNFCDAPTKAAFVTRQKRWNTTPSRKEYRPHTFFLLNDTYHVFLDGYRPRFIFLEGRRLVP